MLDRSMSDLVRLACGGDNELVVSAITVAVNRRLKGLEGAVIVQNETYIFVNRIVISISMKSNIVEFDIMSSRDDVFRIY